MVRRECVNVCDTIKDKVPIAIERSGPNSSRMFNNILGSLLENWNADTKKQILYHGPAFPEAVNTSFHHDNLIVSAVDAE